MTAEALAAFDLVIATAATVLEPARYRQLRRCVARTLGVDDPIDAAVAVTPGDGEPGDACVAFAEQFVVDVAGVTDDQRGALAAAVGGGAETANHVQVLYAVDFELRLRAAFTQLLGDDQLSVEPAATAEGRELWPVIEEMLTAVARLDALDPMTTELVRLRGARAHNCRFCRSLRNVRAVESGGDEAHFDKVDRYEDSDLLEQHKVALRLTDALIWQPARYPAGLVEQVHAHFSPAQVVELMLDVARNALNKFAVAMGVDGVGVDEGGGLNYYDTRADGELVYGLTPAT